MVRETLLLPTSWRLWTATEAGAPWRHRVFATNTLEIYLKKSFGLQLDLRQSLLKMESNEFVLKRDENRTVKKILAENMEIGEISTAFAVVHLAGNL